MSRRVRPSALDGQSLEADLPFDPENEPEDSFVEKMRRKAIELGFKVSVEDERTLLVEFDEEEIAAITEYLTNNKKAPVPAATGNEGQAPSKGTIS